MLLNLSENPEEGKAKIIEEVGEAFSPAEIDKMGGISSGILEVTASSIDIFNILINTPGLKTCTLEIRPDGIIIRFQADLEQYALPIPYYKLKIYKGKAKEYSIYHDNRFMKVKVEKKETHGYLRKIRQLKLEHWSSQKAW